MPRLPNRSLERKKIRPDDITIINKAVSYDRLEHGDGLKFVLFPLTGNSKRQQALGYWDAMQQKIILTHLASFPTGHFHSVKPQLIEETDRKPIDVLRFNLVEVRKRDKKP